MIKVNLLKKQSGQSTSSGRTQIKYETSVENMTESESLTKGVIFKVIVMLLWAGGLKFYENYNIGNLEALIAEKNQRKLTLDAEIIEKKPVAENARNLQKQLQDLESRILSIKELSRIRLREIKAIDYVQNIIPERVWLTSLEVIGDKVNFEGGAMSDEHLNRFMESLEGKSNFKNAILLKAIEQKSKEGTIKIFNITSSLISAE